MSDRKMPSGGGFDRLPLTGLRVFWVLLLFWYEIWIFRHSLRDCQWPDKLPSNTEASPHHDLEPTPTHVLVVADPQILDRRSYPGRSRLLGRFSQFIVDLNLRKSWRAALRTDPHAVVFLGDMMDNGRSSMSRSEYEAYYRRFKSIFKINMSIPQFYLPGNHDVGLGISSAFSKEARQRYISHFGPLNHQVSIANHTIIFLDAPGLVGEDYKRTGLGLDFRQWQATADGPIEFVKSFADVPRESVVLFSHIPLSRPDGTSCGPLREKGTIRRGIGHGYQNMLAKPATDFLLQTIRPSVIFSGDDHDYCEYVHHISSAGAEPTVVREITVKSFSMAMGIRRPGFQLLSLTPTPHVTHAETLCLLPDQLGIYLSVYIPFAIISLLIILLSNVYRTHAFNRRTRSTSSLRLAEDAAWVSSSPADNRGTRLRLDLESENGEQRIDEYPAEDEQSNSPSGYFLPPPASAAHPRHELKPRGSLSRLSWTFVFRGRRRRVTIPISSMVENIKGWRVRRKRKLERDRRGLVGSFVRDVRDVAVFPLGLFSLIAWWMFTY